MKLDPFPRFFPLDRALPFSDAVFAVVITLLVLGIEVPSESNLGGPELEVVREKLGHQVLVYFVSFWIVAMYWAHHSIFFASAKQIGRPIVVMNLMFLMPVTLLPFVTQLMNARRSEWVVVAVFALTNLLAVWVLQRMWSYVVARPEMHTSQQTVAVAKRVRFGLRVFVGVMIVGVLVSLVDVRVGIFCLLLAPIAAFYGYVRV